MRLLSTGSGNKKEVPRWGHFTFTGRLYMGIFLMGIFLAKQFFDGMLLKQPGKEFHSLFIGFQLLWRFIHVERANWIEPASMIGTEARVAFIHGPLAASWSLALVHLFTHLFQPVPRFRQRVGAAPLAGYDLYVL